MISDLTLTLRRIEQPTLLSYYCLVGSHLLKESTAQRGSLLHALAIQDQSLKPFYTPAT